MSHSSVEDNVGLEKFPAGAMDATPSLRKEIALTQETKTVPCHKS